MNRILSNLQERGLLANTDLPRMNQLLAESDNVLQSLLQTGRFTEDQLLKSLDVEIEVRYLFLLVA